MIRFFSLKDIIFDVLIMYNFVSIDISQVSKSKYIHESNIGIFLEGCQDLRIGEKDCR